MNAMLPLRLAALLPLGIFGLLAVFCASRAALTFATDPGPALVFAGIALFATLAYPAMVDVERRIFPQPPAQAARLPLAVYDAFFLGGGVYASWRLAPLLNPFVSIGFALILWVIAGAAARQRVASLGTGKSPRA